MESKKLRNQCEALYRKTKALAEKKSLTERDFQMSELYFKEYRTLYSRMKILQRLEEETTVSQTQELSEMRAQRAIIRAKKYFEETGVITKELKAAASPEWLSWHIKKH
jgi:hypothetical protein